MKTGIIRRIDDLGRVVIPKEIRHSLGIHEGDPLEIMVDGTKVIFELYLPNQEHADNVERLINHLEDNLINVFGKDRDKMIKAIDYLKDAYIELIDVPSNPKPHNTQILNTFLGDSER